MITSNYIISTLYSSYRNKYKHIIIQKFFVRGSDRLKRRIVNL